MSKINVNTAFFIGALTDNSVVRQSLHAFLRRRNCRVAISRSQARRIPSRLNEIIAERLISIFLYCFTREQLRELTVEGNKISSHFLPLDVICPQYFRASLLLEDRGKLPSYIVSILEAGVHSLACFGRVCMARVARQEHAVVLAEVVGESLPDRIRRPPERAGLGDLQAIRVEDTARGFVEALKFDLFGYCSAGKLDVETDHGAAFARDY